MSAAVESTWSTLAVLVKPGHAIAGGFLCNVDGELVTCKAVLERTAVVHPIDHDAWDTTRLVRLDRILVDEAALTVIPFADLARQRLDEARAKAGLARTRERPNTPFNNHRNPSDATTRARLKEVHGQLEQLRLEKAQDEGELLELRARCGLLEGRWMEAQDRADRAEGRVTELAVEYCELEQGIMDVFARLEDETRQA